MFMKTTITAAALASTIGGVYFVEDRYAQKSHMEYIKTEFNSQVQMVASNTDNYLLDLRIEQKYQTVLQFEAVQQARKLTPLEQHLKQDASKSLERLRDIKAKKPK